MHRNMLLIAQVLNSAVTEGFIPAAHKLGYRVTLVTDHGRAFGHYYQQHPSHAPAAIIECDVFNPLAILACVQARGLHPQLVFTNSDHLQTATALVADYLGLPAKNWHTCYRAKHKHAMREHLAKLALPSTWSRRLTAHTPLPEDLQFPLIAKPAEGVSGLHVQRCNDAHALQLCRDNFYRQHPAGELLLEGLLEGPLFTLETLGDGNALVVVGGFDVTLSAPPHFVELQAQWQGPISRRYQREAVAQIKQFGVGLGACHSEFIATPNGPVLVEINYRSVGDQREFLLDQLLPFNWFETILQLHAGRPLAQMPEVHTAQTSDARALIRYLPATQSGHLVQIQPGHTQRAHNVTLQFKPLKQPGERIELSHSNKDYLGVITARNNNESALHPAMDQFVKSLSWEIQA